MDDVRFVFVDNPVIVASDNVPADVDPLHGAPIAVTANGHNFSGSYTPPLHIDIADIIGSMVDPLPEPSFPPPTVALRPGVNILFLAMVEDADALARRRVTVTAGAESWRFYALPGGVSKQNLRFYNSLDTDVFADRFCNYSGNFFMSTRSEDWHITMPETEVAPLCFIADRPMRLRIVERADGNETSVDIAGDGIYALDVVNLRRYFFALGVMANVFDIYVETDQERFACRVAISRVASGMESHPVKFRTSLGVFDVIDLRGSLSYGVEDDADADGVYMLYDTAVGGFSRRRDRKDTQAVIRINTGLKHISSVMHLRDMLSSGEVYINGVRVIPSADEMEWSGDVPNEFAVVFRPADPDGLLAHDVHVLNDSVRHRVHSDEFEDTFN